MAKNEREKRRQTVIEVLNKARAGELHAIHQYMHQHYDLDDADLGELAAKLKLIAIDEMRHAELFAERIKELGGDPTAEKSAKVTRDQAVEAVYPFNAALEDDTIDLYNDFIAVCRDNGDAISQKLFETIVDEEQLHFTYFDNVSDHIKKLGAAYLARIAGTPAETGLPPAGFVIAAGKPTA